MIAKAIEILHPNPNKKYLEIIHDKKSANLMNCKRSICTIMELMRSLSEVNMYARESGRALTNTIQVVSYCRQVSGACALVSVKLAAKIRRREFADRGGAAYWLQEFWVGPKETEGEQRRRG